MNSKLGRLGIWSIELRFGDKAQAGDAAAECEALGFGALWVPGGPAEDVFARLDHLLEATSRATIATGILNVWDHEPAKIAGWWRALPDDRRSRVLLGLGVGHPHNVGAAWGKPLSAMRDYLAQLTAAGMPADALCLAALGPKMLQLAGERTAGVHPYLMTPEHTALARAAVGTARLVAPEQGVVLESDPAKAHALAGGALAHYQPYPNYQNSWRRLGYSEEDIAEPSAQLVDALFACGSIDVIQTRIDAHFAAGADHVCLQAITGAGMDVVAASEVWQKLAGLI